MPKITIYDDELVEYHYEGKVIVLSWEYGKLQLNHPNADQYFYYKHNNISDREKLLSVFPDRMHILTASQLHTKGVTNKIKFKYILKQMLEQGKIDANQLLLLTEFIDSSTCPPIKVFEKLMLKGFENLVVPADFAEDAPELTLCANILEAYIKDLANICDDVTQENT